MTEFWILAIVLIASAVWTISASKPVYSVVALLLNFAALAVIYRDALGRVFGGHPDHRLLRRDPGALRLRDRAAQQRRHAVCDRPEPPAEHLAPRSDLRARRARISDLRRLECANDASARLSGPVGAANVFGSVADFGTALFTVQLLPFEVTALILMVAVIGVITLGGEQMREIRRRLARRRGPTARCARRFCARASG